MAASISINSMQVDFVSVLAMEHTGMAKIFKSLEVTGIKGFLEASSFVFEGAVTEFFANVKGYCGDDCQTVVDMHRRFSGNDVPFRAPNKKKEMNMEYRLLHDIVAKALCAKAGLFDVVTSEKFDLMVAISAGLKVKWVQVLFQTLVAMVHTPTKQSQGFAVQVSVLLQRPVKVNLGEVVKLHPQKVLNSKSVHTYMNKNLNVVTIDESSKQTEDTASEIGGGYAEASGGLEPSCSSEVQVCVQLRCGFVPVGEAEERWHCPKAQIGYRVIRLGVYSVSSSDIPAEIEAVSTADATVVNMETTPEVERPADDTSTAADQEEHVECRNQTEMEDVTKKGDIMVRSGPEQPTQPSIISAGNSVHAPMQLGDKLGYALFAEDLPSGQREGITTIPRQNKPLRGALPYGTSRNPGEGGTTNPPIRTLALIPMADPDPASRRGSGRTKFGITDSACMNQLIVVSVQYGPFNPYIPIRSTTIGKLRVAIDPIAIHTSWRSNSDIASVTSIGYPRMSANGESSTTMHRLLHASGSHPIPPPNDPKTNQYNQDLGLIHSINGNHLESPNEGSSIDHQVTIYLHAQNITMFPTNETWYFASQILVSSSGSLILILTAQSTRNMFRIHSLYSTQLLINVRTNQYNQDLGLIHSTNGNHLESPNEGSSIDHQVTTYLHAQKIPMFPTNETWCFALQMLVSSSGGLILIRCVS
ncbi:hypothetical protein F511_25181 [Dorcoceras hygrometricum]|uniref:Uncharacterized protein n=1 Tax=Dorcoceras hygrometricum TaxID=472368 RepID=A0A2Z7BDL4_9LAMI|nr:hypothetical protein F511_25181 [Dorcoceras hygrometricum]